MCEINNVEDAMQNFEDLLNNVNRHKKSLDTAKKRLDKAKRLLEEEFAVDEEEFKVTTDAGIIKAGPQRKTLRIDNLAVGKALDELELGLSVKLAEYKITEVRKYLSPIVINKLSDTSYGARSNYTFTAFEE